MTTLLAIGTGKGLFLATSTDGRRSWEIGGPHFPMTGVYAVAVDKRRAVPRLLAGMTSSHFGPSVATSDDLGSSWHEPEHAPVAFPADTGASLGRVWQLTPAGPTEPDVVWAGTEPSALFRSADGGHTFELVRALWDHPHRTQWGAGFGGQAVHSVLPHPHDPARLVVAMSTGGVYRSDDAGASWVPGNTGIHAYFLPDEWPEFGQCVHKIARDAGDPERLYAQNHHGVYRSDDGGRSWASIAAGLPSDFGFPMVAHPARPGMIWSFPLVADSQRFPVGHRCRVYRSADAGGTWEPLSAGLPDGPFYPAVLRDAMCADDADPAGVYFGTRSGEVYASRDEGDSWSLVAAHLPDVLCVRAVEV
ncbi:exo-alpha-sialidase [Micromonospora sp. NBC_01655]|uniref:WD40/YVTN/BNR-like repeat-containing protein n=1 Tax=Micromonospora sp. NBC_01655 TaxID=2975983 RepID=UPI0022595904|nr:exo-alpha-sialidase [Micromonospora sp. NBC_01655]MCX4473127.1 exo-alpha-sialidase [Micromonospora sp. NBC_01655]